MSRFLCDGCDAILAQTQRNEAHAIVKLSDGTVHHRQYDCCNACMILFSAASLPRNWILQPTEIARLAEELGASA